MHQQWEMMWSTCHKHRNLPYDLPIPVECSNHWVFFCLFPTPCSWLVDHTISLFFTELKIYHLSLFITHMTILTLLILAVRRTHAIHEPCIWPSSPQVLHTSVVRVSDWCMEDLRFNSWWGLRIFLCPMLVICWLHFSFLHRKLNLTIFLYIAQTMFHKPFL